MKQLSSRVVYANPWMSVREDVVALPDGSESVYGVVDKKDFAVVIAREPGGVWLVEQFRYAVGRRAWELPQGSWAGEARGSAERLAREELREETGLRAEHWEHLGRLQQAYGYASQAFDVWLATGLTEGEPDREASEADMVHALVSDAQLEQMIRSGDVVDATTLAALALESLRR